MGEWLKFIDRMVISQRHDPIEYLQVKTVILPEMGYVKRDDHYPSSHFEFSTFSSFCGNGFFFCFCLLAKECNSQFLMPMYSFWKVNQSDRSSGLNPLEDDVASNDSVGLI